jgi:acetyl esterase/lipase
VQDDGTVSGPGFDLPFSGFASPAARDALVRRLRASPPAIADVAQRRALADRGLRPSLELYAARHPYSSTRSTIGSVPVETFVPAAGIAPGHEDRVLISIHGGGFISGGGGVGGALEAVPIADESKIKVIAVDYRLQPEHTMRDALDDVMTVYREVLRSYRPENIGVYGTSAGAALTGMLTTEALREGLPVPGAIGVFCFPLWGFIGGDSTHLWSRLGSMPGPAPVRPVGSPRPMDPFTPTDEELGRFPPTMFLTGTRAFDMSGTVQSHLELRTRGVAAELVLFDGLDHGFFLYGADFPESLQANRLIGRFFTENLGRTRKNQAGA